MEGGAFARCADCTCEVALFGDGVCSLMCKRFMEWCGVNMLSIQSGLRSYDSIQIVLLVFQFGVLWLLLHFRNNLHFHSPPSFSRSYNDRVLTAQKDVRLMTALLSIHLCITKHKHHVDALSRDRFGVVLPLCVSPLPGTDHR